MKQFSAVKITKLYKKFEHSSESFGSRAPREGDIAFVLDIYDGAVDLECSDKDGTTLWWELFTDTDADFELIEE